MRPVVKHVPNLGQKPPSLVSMQAAREYDEEGRRLRAAAAYARKKRDELAKEIGYPDPRTFDRMTAGSRAPSLPDLRRVAKATGVPLLFLTHGWQLYRIIEGGDADQAARLLRRLLEGRQSPRPQDDEDHLSEPG